MKYIKVVSLVILCFLLFGVGIVYTVATVVYSNMDQARYVLGD